MKFIYNKTNQMHQFLKFTPARKLPTNLYDIYQCRVYSE